jgi:hypothetical protein
MAITAPIPLPQSGMDSFWSGMNNTQNMINSMLQNKLHPYQVELLKAKAEEARNSTANKAFMSNILQQLMGGGSSGGAPDSSLTNQSPQGTFPASGAVGGNGQQMGNAVDENAPTSMSQAPSNAPNAPMNTAGMSRQDLVNRANQDQSKYDMAHQIGNGASGLPQSTIEEGGMPGSSVNPMSNQTPPSNNQMQLPGNQVGQEEVVKQGDPAKYGLDKLSGITMPGAFNIKKDPPKFVDGYQIQTYPSGKVTRIKMGDTWDEKQQKLVQMNGEKEQKKSDIKRSDDIVKSSQAIANAANTVKELHSLLQENKGLTGAAYRLPVVGDALAKLSNNKALGKFDSAAGMLQGDYAKAEATRGGIGLVNWAKNVKPDKTNSPAYNEGMIYQHAHKQLEQFADAKAEWESKNPGKEFPVKMPDLSDILKTEKTDNAHPTKTINGREYVNINGAWHTRKNQ